MNEEIYPQKQKKTRLSKIISISTTILLIVALAFCFTVVVQIQTKRYVSIFGFSVFRVVTDSMEPAIPVGALILNKETDIEKIKVGDIICFRSMESYMNGNIVTHRVVDIRTIDGKVALTTRGDANNSEDSYYVIESNFIGKVISVTGEDSFLLNAYSVLTSGIGFFTLIIIPVVIIAAFILHENLKKIQREMKKLREEMETQMKANPPSLPHGSDIDSSKADNYHFQDKNLQ
ncbi:MAG: signal peptidase I [Clostridia bacterium]|nr:signal peptidase I [Clostridia bacterium]